MVALIISIIPAFLLAATHVLLHNIDIKIQRKSGWHWLSIFSGISVSYVFLGLIPDIERYRYDLNRSSNLDEKVSGRFYALLILLGFTIFYCLEMFVKHYRKRKTRVEDDDPLSAPLDILLPCEKSGPLILHVSAFSVYGSAIAFLLPKKMILFSVKNMFFYYAAMQAHYIIDDMSLHEHFGKKYDKYGRIPLVIATIGGWITGYFVEVSPGLVAGIAAGIAGGSIVNVLKEELPADTRGSIPLFLVGTIGYTLVLVFTY
jgi:uncharacterized membrane protein YeaQ/YmgE (transglycosylase-associated protein family)